MRIFYNSQSTNRTAFKLVSIFFLLALFSNKAEGRSPLVIQEPTRFIHQDLDSSSISDTNKAESRFRIPNNLVPTHYKLYIRPILNESDQNAFTAPSAVTITLKCLKSTSVLVLLADDLTINESTILLIKNDPGELFPIKNVSQDTVNKTISIEAVSKFTIGENYDVRIEYVARIPDPDERMNGMYRSSYVNNNGVKKWVATTQFSRALGFRKMVPSYDEPPYKATFEINVGRQEDYHSLSNMRIKETTPIEGFEGWFWDHYETTPVMPPTVIAIVVSDFANQTAPLNLFHPDKPVSIWGPPPNLENNGAVFTAEADAKILAELERYFELDYELPKMDSVGMPDFQAGAMENWGLNIYRTAYMFWYEGVSPQSAKFSAVSVIAHELSHQFWGNLVTHAWWNDWWITEGFASYYEYRLLENVYPEFEPMTRIVTSDIQSAMTFDISSASVPVHGNITDSFVENPSTINYSKGAALVRMMDAFLTEDVFKKACNFYLKNRRYDAVDQYALFEDINTYLESVGKLPSNGKTMTEIMDTWTLQTGFPLIRVSASSFNPNQIYITQTSFEQGAQFDPKFKSWTIPISYATKSSPFFNETNTVPKIWLNQGSVLASISINDGDWIIVNPDARYYYRVIYDEQLSKMLKDLLLNEIDVVSESSRSMILDDYFTSAYQGYLQIESALEISAFMVNEVKYNPWSSFLKHLRSVYNLYQNDARYEYFADYLVTLMEKAFEVLGFEQQVGDSYVQIVTRSLLLDWACGLGMNECLNYATAYIELWNSDPELPNPIPVDIRNIIYCAAVSKDAQFTWDFMRKKYTETQDVAFFNALKCSQNPSKLQSLLDESVSDEAIVNKETFNLLTLVAGSSPGSTLLVDFLNQSSEYIDERTGTIEKLSSVYEALQVIISDEEDISTLEAIANRHSLGPRLQPTIERMRQNMVWKETFGERIMNWIISQYENQNKQIKIITSSSR